MCTLTWSYRPDGFSVFFNRDELRSRGPGLPPEERSRQDVPYMAPRDSDAGGTWIAANARGLVLCLLNGYVDDPPPPAGTVSPLPEFGPGSGGDTDWITRGSLIDRRIADPDAAAVAAAVQGAPLGRFRSFVLCAFDPGGTALRIAWLHGKLELQTLDRGDMPVSSSSFDTPGVLAARRALWRERFAIGVPAEDRSAELERHRAYHRQRDKNSSRGAYSVCMSRPDACTVSFTEVSVDRAAVRMRYFDAPPCIPVVPSERRIARIGQ